MQREASHQRQQNISQRRCGQHIREIGPGKRVHVRREERKKQKYADGNPGIAHRQKQAANIVNGDIADLLHAVRQHGITGRREDGHPGQH